METIAFAAMDAGLAMTLFGSLCALVSERRRLRAVGVEEKFERDAAALAASAGALVTTLAASGATALSMNSQLACLAGGHPGIAAASAAAAGAAAVAASVAVAVPRAFSCLRPSLPPKMAQRKSDEHVARGAMRPAQR
jgi:hypothetical protein